MIVLFLAITSAAAKGLNLFKISKFNVRCDKILVNKIIFYMHDNEVLYIESLV